MFKNKALIPIFIVVLVDLLGFSIILPLLPIGLKVTFTTFGFGAACCGLEACGAKSPLANKSETRTKWITKRILNSTL